MEIPPLHTVSLSTVLSESKRIVKANYTHFFALSLFFLPLSFSLVLTPTLHPHLSGDFFTGDLFHKFLPNHLIAVIFHLLYILFVYLLTLCAIGTISYSTYHVLIGKPVNYFASIKSLTFSFIPLVSTSILAHTIMFLILLTFLLFVVVIVMLGKRLGFTIDYISISFMWASIITITIIYFQTHWCLASMVVVTESKWGVPALMRSWYSVKGIIRWVSLSLSSNFLLYMWVLSAISSVTVNVSALSSDTQSVVLFTILGSFMLMMFLVVSTVANAVLYMYSKALHGELALEIDEGFDQHYINLSSDDDKVHHVVAVVEA